MSLSRVQPLLYKYMISALDHLYTICLNIIWWFFCWSDHWTFSCLGSNIKLRLINLQIISEMIYSNNGSEFFNVSGAANYLWPGLNTNVGVGRERLHIRQLPPDPERSQEVIKLRDQLSRIRYNTIPPLLRGYTGNRFPGTSIGPPDPIADCKLDLSSSVNYVECIILCGMLNVSSCVDYVEHIILCGLCWTYHPVWTMLNVSSCVDYVERIILCGLCWTYHPVWTMLIHLIVSSCVDYVDRIILCGLCWTYHLVWNVERIILCGLCWTYHPVWTMLNVSSCVDYYYYYYYALI